MTQSGCHSSSGHTRSGVWPPRSAPILTRMPSNSSQAVIDGNGKKYEHLENRLKTFSQWQGLLDYRSMAEAGFVYTGQEDLVFCFHCNIKLDRWSKDMEPLLRHKEESPTCSFMRQRLQAVKRERGKTISVVAPSKPLNSRLTSSIGQLQSSSLVTSKSIHTVVTGLNEPRLSYGGSFDDCPGASLPITPENYQCEAERIKSFVGWPLNEAVHPEQLARVGFVYTGEGALVQCFQCGVKYRHWYKGDVPLNIHQKCNPRCPFLQTLACKSKSSLTEQSPTKSYIESDSAGSNAKGEEVDKYSLQFPDYSDQAIRLQSFKHWGGVLPAQELAEGGFYMIGRLDRVKCFACDVVLHDWERNDNVINEHHKHSPNCRFLRGLTSKTTVTIIVPSKTPSVQSRLELSAETEAGFLSSRPIGSLPPSDNQEVMVPGVCHHPCAYSQEENLSNTRDYFHSPTRSVDSRSASPKNECFKVSFVKVNVCVLITTSFHSTVTV